MRDPHPVAHFARAQIFMYLFIAFRSAFLPPKALIDFFTSLLESSNISNSNSITRAAV